jgi:hypothetical protein
LLKKINKRKRRRRRRMNTTKVPKVKAHETKISLSLSGTPTPTPTPSQILQARESWSDGERIPEERWRLWMRTKRGSQSFGGAWLLSLFRTIK